MKIAVLCVAALAVLQTTLGLAISICRWKYRISVGSPDDPTHPIFRIRTAFGNCAEWHPMLMAMMLVNGMYAGPAWVLWLYPTVVAARCLLILGLTTAPVTRPNPARFLGALGTYILAFLLAGLLINSVLLNR